MFAEYFVETIFETMDLMWKFLDPILKTNQNQTPTLSSPASPPEHHTSTDPIRTQQPASPTGSAIELAPLPATDAGTQPDADQTHPRQRSSTSNNQNPPNAHSL